MVKNLTFENFASKEILSRYRDIRFSLDKLQNGGSENFLNRTSNIVIDTVQITLQADVFRSGVLSFGSKLYLKKVFGAERGDWGRQIVETYVYDRLRCLFFAYFGTKIKNLPNTKCFKGNSILRELIERQSFRFQEGNNNKMIISNDVVLQDDFIESLEDALDVFPNLRNGLRYDSRTGMWTNPIYDGFLEGLYDEMVNFKNNRDYLDSDKDAMYEMTTLTNDSILDQILKEKSNPILNSFLSPDSDKFYFIFPQNQANDNSIEWNESIFLARAIGVRSDSYCYEDNQYYVSVDREIVGDKLTRFDVYAITGLKTEALPLSPEQIDDLLDFRSDGSIPQNRTSVTDFVNGKGNGGNVKNP
jgi:hypothetical protein